jgi:hypothetical protein
MKQYLDIQKDFWNVDEHAARFGRIDTVSRRIAREFALSGCLF